MAEACDCTIIEERLQVSKDIRLEEVAKELVSLEKKDCYCCGKKMVVRNTGQIKNQEPQISLILPVGNTRMQ